VTTPARIDAVVCALDEESTIGGVLAVLRESGVIGKVVVVDDGSRDATANIVPVEGAEVVSLYPNRGKGQAMRLGAQRVSSDPVAFFDADLLGLTPDHVRLLARHADLGFDMVCGLRDHGVLGNPVQYAVGQIITGERIVRRWVLDAVPESCWSGYVVETGINWACSKGGGRIALVPLREFGHRRKHRKRGFVRGLYGDVRMFSAIRRAEENLRSAGTC